MTQDPIPETIPTGAVEAVAKFDWERAREATEAHATSRQQMNLARWDEAWHGEQEECRAEARALLAAALPELEAAWRERLLSDEAVMAAAKARYEGRRMLDPYWDNLLEGHKEAEARCSRRDVEAALSKSHREEQ